MAEIIDLNKEKNKITQEDLKELTSTLEEVLGTNDNFDIISSMSSLLDMDEDNFKILAPGLIQSFQQSVNNPNDKILLVQALNATGTTANEFTALFSNLVEDLDKIESLSQPKKDFIKQLIGSMVSAINDTEGIAKRYIEIPIELCHENAKIPQYANISDSGMDVYALDDYTINPGETKLIPTGIKLASPPGYEIQVRPKSGRALKTKLRIANTPGTIVAGYRDEIGVIVENIEAPIKDITYHFNDDGKIILDSILHGASHTIGQGEKFCQLVLCEVPKAALYRVETVGQIGEDRGGGFGSTGLK